MSKPLRGEVWLVDLGLAAKVRPCLVLSIPPKENERALYTLIAHTTSMRVRDLKWTCRQDFCVRARLMSKIFSPFQGRN